MECGIASIQDPDVCAWNGSQWKNAGNGSPTGTVVTGTATTEKASGYYGPYTWGNYSGISAEAGPDRVIESGDTARLGEMLQEHWDYDWTPTANVEQTDTGITRAWPSTTTKYFLEVEGENNCTATDSMVVYISVLPEDTVPATDHLAFIDNQGQYLHSDGSPANEVSHYNTRMLPTFFARSSGWSHVVPSFDGSTGDVLGKSRVDIDFTDCDEVEPLPLEEASTIYNFFLSHCPEGIIDVKSHKRLIYPELYPDIDLHVYNNGQFYKFYFVFRPGADPDTVSMLFTGVDAMLSGCQDTVYYLAGGQILILPQAEAYEMDGNGDLTPLNWDPGYSVTFAEAKVGFCEIGTYDTNETLVFKIDAEFSIAGGGGENRNREWSTYFYDDAYPAASEEITDVEVNDDGDLYAVGSTGSPDLYPVNAGFYPENAATWGPDYAGTDLFIARFSENYVAEIYTFFGSEGFENSNGLTLDASSNVYISGVNLGTGLPVSGSDIFESNFQGGVDGIIASFGPNLNVYNWGTYYGGSHYDFITDLTWNASAGLVVGGYTYSTDITAINSAGSYHEPSFQGGETDGIFATFNASTGECTWNTYFGDDGEDIVSGVILTQGKRFQFTGYTSSSPGDTPEVDPVTSGWDLVDPGSNAYVHALVGGTDATLGEFNDSRALMWLTCFGGDGDENKSVQLFGPEATWYNLSEIASKTIDSEVITVIGGTTDDDSNFELEDNAINGAYHQESYQGGRDGFVAKFVDRVLDHSTLFGGSDNEYIMDVGISESGHVFITGQAGAESAGNAWCAEPTAGEFPLCDNNTLYYYQDSPAGDVDVFLAGFDQDMSLYWSTPYGGALDPQWVSDWESAYGIAVDGDERVILGGTNGTLNFPTYDHDPLSELDWFQQGTINGAGAFLTAFTINPQVVGVGEQLSVSNSLIAHPNPTTGNLVISSKEIIHRVQVMDLLGRTVYEVQPDILGLAVTMDLSFLAKQAYVVMVTTVNNTQAIKVVLQ